MQFEADTVDGYIAALPEDRQTPIKKLRTAIKTNLPDGFEEQLAYGMIGYVVPLSRYPQGYHVKEGEPLPFLSLASQKNYIALYHMGLYADPALEPWFAKAYADQVPTRLDMGKSCIRLKNPDHIPYDLIGKLCQKITVEQFIQAYEKAIKRN